jgi:hypothetical protein
VSELVDLHDVRMTNTGDDARLIEEHLDEALLAREMGKNALDDDGALEAARPDEATEENFGHATGGERAHHIIAADLHGDRLLTRP